MASYVVVRGTAEFPMDHTFVEANHSGDPTRELISVSMTDFVVFLGQCREVQFCTLRVKKTKPAPGLKPLSDYVTIATQPDPSKRPRTHKYAEGFWNLALTDKGKQLNRPRIDVLMVERQCLCGAVQWRESVTVGDLTRRTVQIRFTSFRSMHTVECVPAGTTARPGLLIGNRVAVKELGREITAVPSQIEEGSVNVSVAAHDPSMVSTMLSQGKAMDVKAIKKTLEHSRSIGREDGDFSAVHHMLSAAASRAVQTKTLDDFNILEYHPAIDPQCANVEDARSWYYMLVQMPYAQRDMAAHASQTGLAYDGKVKVVISHGLVAMPFLTTRPALPIGGGAEPRRYVATDECNVPRLQFWRGR